MQMDLYRAQTGVYKMHYTAFCTGRVTPVCALPWSVSMHSGLCEVFLHQRTPVCALPWAVCMHRRLHNVVHARKCQFVNDQRICASEDDYLMVSTIGNTIMCTTQVHVDV